MTLWLCVLLTVAAGAVCIAVLSLRAQREIDPTIGAFDESRRDLRLALVELRVERDRVARRVAAMRRHEHGPGQG